MLVLWPCAGTLALCWYFGLVLVLWPCAGTLALCWYFGLVLVLDFDLVLVLALLLVPVNNLVLSLVLM